MNKLNTRIVLRNDSTANWLSNKDQILLKGEVGIEFLDNGKVKMKIGDGQHTWEELGYFGGDEGHVFETTVAKGGNHNDAIATIVGSTTLSKGDVAIVREGIVVADKVGTVVNGVTIEQKYQYTAYVFNGTAWVAMDGNYNAENVYFDSDFTFTTNIGTVTGVTTSKVVDAAGKNLKQFLSGLFAKETPGLKKDGSEVKSDTSVEVGTKFTPSYSTSFEDGKYAYGPEPTGVTVTNWAITSTAGESWATATGTGTAKITMGDQTGDVSSYSLSATATYTEGSPAKSNIGNVGTVKIPAGSKGATSKKITCFRYQFGGATTTKIDTSNMTGAYIIDNNSKKIQPGETFACSKTGKNENGFLLTIPQDAAQVYIALYGKTLKNVYDTGAFGTDIFGSFTNITATKSIAVSNTAKDYTEVNYNVYVYTPDTKLGSNTYEVVIG